MLNRTNLGLGGLGVLLGICLFLAVAQCPAGSIFDDDFTPAAPSKPSDHPAPTVPPDTTPAPNGFQFFSGNLLTPPASIATTQTMAR